MYRLSYEGYSEEQSDSHKQSCEGRSVEPIVRCKLQNSKCTLFGGFASTHSLNPNWVGFFGMKNGKQPSDSTMCGEARHVNDKLLCVNDKLL